MTERTEKMSRSDHTNGLLQLDSVANNLTFVINVQEIFINILSAKMVCEQKIPDTSKRAKKNLKYSAAPVFPH